MPLQERKENYSISRKKYEKTKASWVKIHCGLKEPSYLPA
jgi:hypothetical protein